MAKRKRKITSVKIIPWLIGSFLGAVLLFNISLSLLSNDCEITRRKLFFQKDNPALRIKLVSCLIDQANYSLAEKELSRLEKDNLDSSWQEQIKTQELRLKSSNPELRKKEIVFWKEKIVENQSYPDAWVSLALLWYSQGDKQKARLAMQKSCQLDKVRQDIRETAERIGFPCPI